MISIIDIDTISSINSFAGLIDAVEESYNNDVNASKAYVMGARLRIKAKAVELGCEHEIQAIFDDYDNRTEVAYDFKRDIDQRCSVDRRGNILPTSENFLTIMNLDPAYTNVRYNLLTHRPETKDENGNLRGWTDYDDAASRTYIEREYGIHNSPKHEDAFKCLLQARSIHPIKQLIEGVKWDGEDRIATFLHKYTMCEDTPYTREVSRLIFAGGIHRLYDPGCKFDDMPVLIGKQGAGKSTIVRWIALDDKYFREVNEFEGKAGMEILDGAWICEVSEMLAMTKAREQAAVKSYLSRLVDSYRPSYGKHVIDRPRSCVFIGTSNNAQFVTDKTGARRFYPVECNLTGYELHDIKDACKADVLQCWAEALAKYDTPFMYAYADRSLKPTIDEQQESAIEEDYRVGMIEKYLTHCTEERVCTLLLWEKALGYNLDYKRPEKSDQTQIGLIMRNMPGWKRNDWKHDFGDTYGMQKHWKREKGDFVEVEPGNDFPF